MNIKSIAIDLSVSVLILMLPFLIAVLFDYLFRSVGFDTDLLSFVAPIYVLAMNLIFVVVAFIVPVFDIVINFFVNLINLLPVVDIGYVDISGKFTAFQDTANIALSSFISALSISLVKTAIVKNDTDTSLILPSGQHVK